MSDVPPSAPSSLPSDNPLAAVQRSAQVFYDEAWDKTWPGREKRTLHKFELDVDAEGNHADLADELSYECIPGMDRVASALRAQPSLRGVVVVRKEYETLVESLTKGRLRSNTKSVVVTGHPGIGKTTFLLFLLLYRLEHRLPTALQLNSRYYFIFDKDGVAVHHLNRDDDRLRECWALVDSNVEVMDPCGALLNNATRVIQTTSPRVERWKEWKKQYNAAIFIMDLPNGMEIAAIVKERAHNPSSTLVYLNKWGPSVRTILAIMEAVAIDDEHAVKQVENELQSSARAAAATICETPALFRSFSGDVEAHQGALPSVGSSLLFLVPDRERWSGGNVELYRNLGAPTIPTKHLSNIFFAQWAQMNREKALDLYCVFSSHSLTKSSAGWLHELRVHTRLCVDGKPLGISRGRAKGEMQPATCLVAGTMASLQNVEPGTSFYWLPSVANVPGIDGVLGVRPLSRLRGRKHDIYVVQATIANTHSSPLAGLKRLFPLIQHLIANGRHLNFVVVADEEVVAERLVSQFSKDLEKETFIREVAGAGRKRQRKRVYVKVWGCALPAT